MMKTALYQNHLKNQGKMVDFAGWQMPIHYGSQVEEHHAVRQHAGMFDVSHMTILDLQGSGCKPFLSNLLANNIHKLKDSGKALYSCMLNDAGGVIDDLIVYYLDDEHYRMVVNAATHDKDLQWIGNQSKSFPVEIMERTDLSMIAVQGPEARKISLDLFSENIRTQAENLTAFFACQEDHWFIARTGYTGEDGFEIMLPNDQASEFWQNLYDKGIRPCGLGARDTLRLEAGMHLYGNDMDENIIPLECGLSWTVDLKSEREFVGKQALIKAQENGLKQKLVGLLLLDKGILRAGQSILLEDQSVGIISSGGFSPTLQKSIALARVNRDVTGQCQVEVRGKKLNAQIVKPPFVRNGKACYQ